MSIEIFQKVLKNRSAYVRFHYEEETYMAQVYYDAGGNSMLTGNHHTRGYYLSVVPIKINRTNNPQDYIWYTVEAWTGLRKLLLQVNRFSNKIFSSMAKLLDNLENDEGFKELFNAVIAKESKAIA
jgi:hypothetical protein